MIKGDFSLDNTNYCKGIAIILMIVHHLFWNVPGIGTMIGDISLSQRIGIVGKVCVSIFLFLSGFGLYKSTKENFSVKYYYSTKLFKLYMNYLFIVCTSVIIIFMFFYDKVFNVISSGMQLIKDILLSLTGLQYIIDYGGINGAWWFMTVIIVCYLIFPIIKIGLERYKTKFLIMIFIMSFSSLIPLEGVKIFDIISWIFPFVFGIYVAQYNLLDWIKKEINNKNTVIKKEILIILLLAVIIIRQEVSAQGFIGLRLDYLLSFIIILSVYVFWENIEMSKKVYVT